MYSLVNGKLITCPAIATRRQCQRAYSRSNEQNFNDGEHSAFFEVALAHMHCQLILTFALRTGQGQQCTLALLWLTVSTYKIHQLTHACGLEKHETSLSDTVCSVDNTAVDVLYLVRLFLTQTSNTNHVVDDNDVVS